MATRNEIIQRAFQLTGEYSIAETISAPDVQIAADFLGALISEYVADGMHIWKRELTSFSPTAGTASYTIGASGTPNITMSATPNAIHDVFIRDSSGHDQKLNKLSRAEYMILSSKSEQGRPNQYYYQKTIPNGTFTLYPTPDSNTATNLDVYLDVEMPFDAFTVGSTDQDFPPEWTRLLTYGLAVDLSILFAIPDNQYQKIMAGYMQAYQRVLANDPESETSVMFTPDLRGGWKGRR